jgi:hypothetical protein
MFKILYATSCGSIENAYRNGDELVVRPEASLPDICVGCGNPAFGNLKQAEFYDLGEWWILLPSIPDFIALTLRRQYLFEFPFCSSCPPDRFRLKKIRLDDYLAIFSNAPKSFLNALPFMPENVVIERNKSWFRRRFRRLLS